MGYHNGNVLIMLKNLYLKNVYTKNAYSSIINGILFLIKSRGQTKQPPIFLLVFWTVKHLLVGKKFGTNHRVIREFQH